MKNLQNLKGAKALSKKEQLAVNGGAGSNVCDDVCPSSGYGWRCDSHPLCPGFNDGMCDGNGGWYYL